MIVIKGGVTAPEGFLANGVKAGIKKSGNKDLAIIYSEAPAAAAGSFTTNRFIASPVKVSKANLSSGTHRAIIVNSGNANCANGKRGDADAVVMGELAACALDLKPKEVLVASTGIIGRAFPLEKVAKATPDLIKGLSGKNGSIFAETIMTTDTKKKEIAVKERLGGKTVTIGGACKGVGMIHPIMKLERHATMLAFITTDAAISKKMLEEALKEAIEDSFNMVSVDGDMSTNDSCFILANGLAGNRNITSKNAGYNKFVGALKYMAMELAKMIAGDGEGATKLVEITVKGAKTTEDAKTIARKISTSNLLKCAIFGQDPNWGRIAASAGSAGIEFDPAGTDIYLSKMKVLSNGSSMPGFNEKKAHELFCKKNIYITVDLKSGNRSARAWTCDFSKEYVAINSEYST
jgi:glutamate N-acetyltransferase / amino-acid N-acetyltransferase